MLKLRDAEAGGCAVHGRAERAAGANRGGYRPAWSSPLGTLRGAQRGATWRTDQKGVAPVGDVEVKISKPRKGLFFPELLEPSRRVDQVLWGVIMTAYVTGMSARKVDDLVKALGCATGMSKPTVSRIGADIDREVAPVRE